MVEAFRDFLGLRRFYSTLVCVDGPTGEAFRDFLGLRRFYSTLVCLDGPTDARRAFRDILGLRRFFCAALFSVVSSFCLIEARLIYGRMNNFALSSCFECYSFLFRLN